MPALRTIINNLRGLRKTADELLDFPEVYHILGELKMDTRINIFRFFPNKNGRIGYIKLNAAPEDTANFVREMFQPGNNIYCTARHQVFQGAFGREDEGAK